MPDGKFIGVGRPMVDSGPVDPALHLVGAGAATPGDVLSYRALWDDYVLQTVCAYNVLAWALGFLIQGQSPPNTIDVTAPSIAGIPYCVRTIPAWNYALPLVDTSQFGDNPPTVVELTSVQAAATTSAAALLDRWNVWSNLSDYEIVQDAAQILTSMQGVVSDVGTTERPYLSKYSPSLGAAIVQGPSESTQARIIAQLEGAKIVAGGVLTVFGFGVQGAIDSTATLGQWTAQHAKELGSGVTGLAAFLLSPWTLSIVGLLIVGSVGLAVYNAEKVAKLTSAFKPSLSIGGETKRRKKRRKMAA